MTDQPNPSAAGSTRRQFLAGSTAAFAAAAVGPLAVNRAAYAASNETLRVGLVGCGNRGTGAAVQALNADPNARLVAMADTFPDQIEASLDTIREQGSISDRVDVDQDHRFTGFDGYQHLIDSDVDVVLLAAPPGFRPEHLRAAVEAGKHVFAEKPVAVDAPGVRSCLESARIAREKSLNIVSGLCYRYEFAKRETFGRVHDGAIGDIVALQATYNTEGVWVKERQPDWSDMEWQVRNWVYFTWLSGDFIAEQHIHSLDKLVWAMGDQFPVQCSASGGRQARTDPRYGHIWDHFNTVYEWENGVRGFASCRHWPGSTSDVSDFAFGSNGTAHLQTHRIDADEPWRHRSDRPDNMYQNQHDELFAAIRAGEPINDGEIVAKSTLMAIMGRLAAYTGQTLTWDQVMNSQEDLRPEDLSWDGEWPIPPVAVPGEYQFV